MKTLTEAVKACGGVWPSKAEFGLGIGWNGIGDTSDREPDFIQLGINGPEFTRPEFEAEAARLSGKPGWGEAPEWAEGLAQDSNGRWFWFSGSNPIPFMMGPDNAVEWDVRNLSKFEWATKTFMVLGDWRDTLERRPEGVADSVPPAPMWMPPADSECEMLWTSPDEYYRVKIFGYDGDEAVGKWLNGPSAGKLFSEVQRGWGPVDCRSHFTFRPLKSDRERWVAAALAQDCPPSQGMMSRTEFCEALYDALKSGELPMPE